MGSKVRVGVVGAGMMGREHIRNLKLFGDVAVTALADPVVNSLDKALKTLGDTEAEAHAFESVEAMLAAGNLDAVIVSSPNHTHRALLEPLLASGLAILCEKPLCTTIDDARWAAGAGGRAGRGVCSGPAWSTGSCRRRRGSSTR